MANPRVEQYAHQHGLSNKQAKKRLGEGARSGSGPSLPIRRGPVAGTGKPRGAEK